MNRKCIFPAFAAVLLMVCSNVSMAAVSVTKYHNDNGGTGVNNQETVLTPAVVRSNFGKLYSLPVDGQIYAQPLYMPGVAMAQPTNVLYVATEHNSVYAFDADSPSAAPLWHVNFGVPILCSQIPECDRDLTPEIGITSTPVIDPARHAIYVVAETFTMGKAAFTLHSLDLATGSERPGSPVVIAGKTPGSGDESDGTTVTFNAVMHFQRAALLMLNGNIYVAFAAHQDTRPYHGWIFGYDDLSMRLGVVKCMSPNAWGGGIWQGGAGLTADAVGNVYAATGNGAMTASTGGLDYGDSVVKMKALANLAVTSYFSPSNQGSLDVQDLDIGSGGVIVVPASAAQQAPLLLAGGKDGRIFVLNSAALGGFNSGIDTLVQEFQGADSVFGGKVYFNNALYIWGAGENLRRFAFDGTSFSPSSFGSFTTLWGYSNQPAMSISSNALSNGILWASWSVTGQADGGVYPGTLHAFDASDVSVELWNSGQVASDASGSWAKWVPPTIANGKVYLATFDGAVSVFGLLH